MVQFGGPKLTPSAPEIIVTFQLHADTSDPAQIAAEIFEGKHPKTISRRKGPAAWAKP